MNKLKPIFYPTAQQLIDASNKPAKKVKINWKQLNKKVDKEIMKEMRNGVWRQWVK